MEKTVVIVNPIAGNGKSMELWPEVRAYLSSLGLDFEERLTQRQGHVSNWLERPSRRERGLLSLSAVMAPCTRSSTG